MKELKFALIKTLPVTVSYFFVSIAFGIMMTQAGFGAGFSALSSLFVYTGAFQFVLVTFFATGASLVTVFFTALFMNSRHIFYGISLIEDYKATGRFFPFMIMTLSDETYSLLCSTDYPEGVRKAPAMVWISFLDWFFWFLGSITGAVLGQLIPFDFAGIDFALTALFVTIFLDQWKSADSHLPALTGLIVGVIFLIIFGADNFILPALILSTGLMILTRPMIVNKTPDKCLIHSMGSEEQRKNQKSEEIPEGGNVE